MEEEIYELMENEAEGFKIDNDNTCDWAIKVIKKETEEIERLIIRLENAKNKFFDKSEHSLDILSGKLKLLNPLTMIDKGFVPVYLSGKMINRAEKLTIGENISLKFTDGTVNCEITDIITEN